MKVTANSHKYSPKTTKQVHTEDRRWLGLLIEPMELQEFLKLTRVQTIA
jgi:hypothetical protein